jgi:hypothetical protein
MKVINVEILHFEWCVSLQLSAGSKCSVCGEAARWLCGASQGAGPGHAGALSFRANPDLRSPLCLRTGRPPSEPTHTWRLGLGMI